MPWPAVTLRAASPIAFAIIPIAEMAPKLERLRIHTSPGAGKPSLPPWALLRAQSVISCCCGCGFAAYCGSAGWWLPQWWWREAAVAACIASAESDIGYASWSSRAAGGTTDAIPPKCADWLA
jgi:hypothetical protein